MKMSSANGPVPDDPKNLETAGGTGGGAPKSEAQLKREAKREAERRAKQEKFEAKKRLQQSKEQMNQKSEVWLILIPGVKQYFRKFFLEKREERKERKGSGDI